MFLIYILNDNIKGCVKPLKGNYSHRFSGTMLDFSVYKDVQNCYLIV